MRSLGRLKRLLLVAKRNPTMAESSRTHLMGIAALHPSRTSATRHYQMERVLDYSRIQGGGNGQAQFLTLVAKLLAELSPQDCGGLYPAPLEAGDYGFHRPQGAGAIVASANIERAG